MTVRPALVPLACALLLASPGHSPAQEGTGARIAPTRPAARAEPPGGALVDGVGDPATLLRLAERTLAAGRLGETTDLLERAEARLLTRSEVATRAGRPLSGGAVGAIAAAREALGRRDQAAAEARLADALSLLDDDHAPAAEAKAPEPVPPAATGGPAPLPRPSGWGGPGAAAQPLPGIVPQDIPAGGTASPPVAIAPDIEVPRQPPPPGAIAPSSTKPPPS
ncbi:hypothetical protein [Falsiroseomonas sp. CW058]|uniref:hypothetical protein n=1 Tax=Falsiroseomonas sp. CW058 TaxID=3388664 RepID=UPI003D316D5B